MAGHDIREVDPWDEAEIGLVAARMRQTLVEVLGEEVGGGMYTMEWLVQRVRWHLDRENCDGQVFLSVDGNGAVCGHMIVRIETDESGRPFGLFSTIYVVPEARRLSIATGFVRHGEQWMRERGATTATTYTAADNTKLKSLFFRLGYAVVLEKGDMVALSRVLDGPVDAAEVTSDRHGAH